MARKGTELKLGVETLEARTVLNATVTLGAAGQGLAIAAAVDNGNDTIKVFTVGGKVHITDTGVLTLNNLGPNANVVSHTKHTIVLAKGVGGGDLTIAAGQADKVTIGKGLVAGKPSLTVGGDLTINTAGKAAVTLNGVAVNGETNVNLNGVSSKAANLTITKSHLGLKAEIDTTGSNLVNITSTKFGGDVTYKGAVGNNGGVDVVATKGDTFFGKVNVNTGADNDKVIAVTDFFGKQVTLNGGTGTNTLTNTGNNFQQNPVIVNFA
ncbi:MAG TPA: hypothetical protein VHB77_22695 [Planctomycetaceae bacterium]|nr:hypothetical protein [Planctomycetaceae bacterium]